MELNRSILLNILHVRKQPTLLHQRQSRATKAATPAFQFKQDPFPALKPMTSPRRPHATWAQTASQPPPKTDPLSLSSFVWNSENFSHSVQQSKHVPDLTFIILQLQTNSDTISKVMLVLDTVVACFLKSI